MPRGIRKNGRPALTRQAFARLTEAQHVAYLRLGGADWLRSQIEQAAPHLAATPCANNPFPILAEPLRVPGISYLRGRNAR